MLQSPRNLSVQPTDGGARSSWDAVSGADGYILYFYSTGSEEKRIKMSYAQKPSKSILGLENGKKYKVQVCAFHYEGGKEILGELSDFAEFIPESRHLKAQKAICLQLGKSADIKWEYRNTIPAVSFASSDGTIATVDNNGRVTAHKEGHAVISVDMNEKEHFSVDVFVERDLSRVDSKKAVIMMAGDLMCAVGHQRKARSRSYDFSDSFSNVQALLSRADFSIGVLETTCYDMAPYEVEQLRTDTGKGNCNSPSTFLKAVKYGGFDALVTANNHICDTGYEGMRKTIDLMEAHGLYNVGALNGNPFIKNIKGITVAVIACCMISNGREGDCKIEGMNTTAQYSSKYFSAMVQEAKQKGAQYIIAYQHFGMINSTQVRKTQIVAAREMAELGADCIVGSHPQVLQRFDVLTTSDGRKVPCAYSLGNTLTSTQELAENRYGALIRLELSNDENGIQSKFSYIPVLCSDTENGVLINPIFNPLAEAEKEAFGRIRKLLGGKINPYGNPRVMLQGSVVLNKIFEARTDVVTDGVPLILSPLSFCSKKYGELPVGEKSKRVKIDVEKNFDAYLSASLCEFIVIDFYTAAAISMYKLEDSYYTASQAFQESKFFQEHSGELQLLQPPFKEKLWKRAIENYAEMLLRYYDKQKIILIRLNISDKCVKYSELRDGDKKGMTNQRMRAMEQYFINLVDPMVIDVSGQYFKSLTEKSASAYEPFFYVHVNRILDEIFEGTAKHYFSDRDEDLFLRRVIKYYDNMTARSCQSWLLDSKNPADLLIKYSSKQFVAENRDHFIKFRKIPYAKLTDAKSIFAADITAQDFVAAANALDSLLKKDISQPYEHYSIIFKRKLNAEKLIAQLLSYYTGRKIPVEECEMVFLIKDDMEKLEEYFTVCKKVSVDIWGSCISRTAVNHNLKLIDLNRYIFKQPPVLAFEEDIPYDVPVALDKFKGNAWRRRTICEAFRHQGISLLKNSHADWIIVDFYDLIAHMSLFENSIFETDNFIKSTGFYADIKHRCKETFLFREKDQNFCDKRITDFANFMIEKYGKNIILVKADLKGEYISLDNELLYLKEKDVLEEKRAFITRYEQMFAELTDCYVIDISKHYYSDDRFPLGGAHIVHYEEDFYVRCGKYISEILLGTEQRIFTEVDQNYLMLRDLRLSYAKRNIV